MVSCILLSAGESSRFGSPKALAKLKSEHVITRLQSMLISSLVDEIIVVLGFEAERIKPALLNHKKVRVVHNKDYKFGQTSSFKEGLRDVSKESKGVMLLPVDYPLIQTETVDLLIEKFIQSSPLILIPTYKDKKGHPPFFSTNLSVTFNSLDNAVGINTVIHENEQSVILFPVEDKGVVSSFNTKEEFEELAEF